MKFDTDTFCVTHIHDMSIVGVRKERRIINSGPSVKPEKAAPVNGTALRTTGPVPMDFRQ